MKWSIKRFTFVIIPDANSSVKRFHLPAVVLVIIPVFILTLIASVLALVLLYRGNAGDADALRLKLSDSTGRYEQLLAEKDDRIDTLQTKVAGLSDQAKSIQQKINEVNQVESQVKDMVGLHTSGTSKTPPASDSTVVGGTIEDGNPSDGGMGGEDLPVTDEEIDALLADTQDDLLVMGPALDELIERLVATKSDVAKAQKALQKTPTIWPTDNRRITSLFGVRTDPFTHRARFHAGIDIAGDTGDPIYAAADGTVLLSEKDSAEGNNILISHGNGIQTRYMHMSKLIAKVGQKVQKGEVIGELGSTGRSTGPHLHYEVLLSGKQSDPRPYLKASRKGSE